jgi:hypothetical protein
LRPIRKLVDEALLELSPAFSKLYAREGRPSIPPNRLLRALLLQAFYTVRSERLLMEQLEYNLLFRWFAGLSMDDAFWDVAPVTGGRRNCFFRPHGCAPPSSLRTAISARSISTVARLIAVRTSAALAKSVVFSYGLR